MTAILVTGATGTVGSALVGALGEGGARVRALVRDAARAAEQFGGDVDLAVADFADLRSVEAALAGIDTLFLACGNHPEQVAWEIGAIDAAVATGVGRVVKLSAVGAEIGSALAFWDWHGRIEAHLAASGVAATVLRPATYMSNLLRAAGSLRASGTLVAPAGGAKIAMVDPRDVAAAAAVVLCEDGHDLRTYTLTGPEAVTYEHVAEDLAAAVGRHVTFVDVPDEAAHAAMVEAGLPAWLADNLTTLFRLMRAGAMAETTDTVQALTGHPPRSVAEFARDHADLLG